MDGGPQQTSMCVMRNCTRKEVRRCVRCAVILTESSTKSEFGALSSNVSCK